MYIYTYTHRHTHTHTHTHIYVYIYLYICTHTHTLTHTYIQVVDPDYGGDYFSSHGDAYLQKQMVLTQQLLMGNFVTSTALASLMLAMLRPSISGSSIHYLAATLQRGAIAQLRRFLSCCRSTSASSPLLEEKREGEGTPEVKHGTRDARIPRHIVRGCSMLFVLLKVQMLCVCIAVGEVWCVCVHTCIRIYICLYMYMYIFICIYVYVCIYIYVFVYINMYVCACIYIQLCICICTHIYINILTQVHI